MTNFKGAADLCGLSVDDIGEELGVSNKTVQHWLAGRRDVPDFAWGLVQARWQLIEAAAHKIACGQSYSDWMMTDTMKSRAAGLSELNIRMEEINV